MNYSDPLLNLFFHKIGDKNLSNPKLIILIAYFQGAINYHMLNLSPESYD